MASILHLVLCKQLSVTDVVQWLSCDVHKENTKEILEPLESQKAEFLPYFLNCLRDQTSSLVQTSQSSGLTPKKSLQNNYNGSQVDGRSSARQTESAHKNAASRTRLFPSSPGTVAEDGRTSSRSPVFNRKAGKSQQAAANCDRQHAKACTPSERKLNLGQFIQPGSYSTSVASSQRKKYGQHAPVNAQQVSAAELPDTSRRAQQLNLNDLELFPPVGNSQAKTKENRRRISPIVVSVQKIKKQDAFSNAVEKEQDDSKNREVPVAFEADVESKRCPKEAKDFKQESVACTKIVVAKLDEVYFKQELDILISLYCTFIDENLIPNLSVELYFLVQLLTVRHDSTANEKTETTLKSNNFLCSVHNCVYFSVQVLYYHRRLLKLLDNATLKMLSGNSRVAEFSPGLKNYLGDAEKNKENQNSAEIHRHSLIGSVAFQSDTDNRNNFPDDRTFQIFRKQRDDFYSILRDWEYNHLTPGWSMSVSLAKKIQNVICTWPDPSLYCHLARLFLNQLIAMCKGDASDDQKDDVFDDLQLLSDFKRTNPEKFKRLQERFIKPFQAKGPSPAPSFSGPQEFFCEFILLASCPTFNQHIVDNLIFQILQLNEIKGLTDNENDGLKEQFTSTLMTLRILAKFLGFMVFSPYKSRERLPQALQENIIAMRNKIPFPLDLNLLLKEAVAQRKLTLTIPWLVEFLSMMDINALLVKAIQDVLVNLVFLYRSSILQLKHEKVSLNKLLLLLLLGWLFEIHSLSSSIFFAEICVTDERRFVVAEHSNADNLDSLELVDHDILYTCCPFLRELKFLLSDFAAGMNNRSSSIKKIVPIAADEHGKPSLSVKHLEEQLEENFFHNQPVSLRKSVEFVSERMASNVIKHVKKVVMTDVRKIGYSKVYEEFLKELTNTEKVKKRLFTLKQDVSVEMCNLVKLRANEALQRICCEKIEPALKLLLSEDITPSVFVACNQIATRTCKQKVLQWISTYVVPNLFTEEVQNEIERYKKQNALSPNKLPVFHSPVSPSKTFSSRHGSFSATDTFMRIKNYIQEMYTRTAENLDDIDKVIDDMYLIMLPVMEVDDCLKKPVMQLSVDCAFGLVLLQPELLTESRLTTFLSFWQQHPEPEFLAGLMCSRNVLLLQSSSKSNESWSKFEMLLRSVMSEKIIKRTQFEANCLQVLKREWSQDLSLLLSNCLKHVVEREDASDELTELKKVLYSSSVANSVAQHK